MAIKHILIVEDDPILAELYEKILSVQGYGVLIVKDGKTALSTAIEKRVDLILLDVMLPELNGLDMLARLREDPRGENIPVVVLTNSAKEEERKRAIETLQAKEYLVKAKQSPETVVEVVKKYTATTD